MYLRPQKLVGSRPRKIGRVRLFSLVIFISQIISPISLNRSSLGYFSLGRLGFGIVQFCTLRFCAWYWHHIQTVEREPLGGLTTQVHIISIRQKTVCEKPARPSSHIFSELVLSNNCDQKLEKMVHWSDNHLLSLLSFSLFFLLIITF